MKIKLLAKAGAVMDALCSASAPMSLKELSVVLDMPVPTLSRLCNDMVEMQWLIKSDYHHFAPGIAMLRFGTHAERLSPQAASALPLIREYSLRSGLNGLLSGYTGGSFFKFCSCAQKTSDQNIFRRSGAFLALLSACNVSQDEAKSVVRKLFSDLSDVEVNTLDREFDALQRQKLLLRVGTMRQWYITVPFSWKEIGCALTFYGHGNEKQQVESACAEVAQTAAKIRSAWGRMDEK